ncbi:MAG: hypothetical protein JXQ96_21715 [Cyclobacteriaceae bacterium]
MKNLVTIAFFLTTINLLGQERILVKDSLQKDIELLYQVLDKVHAGTYRYLSRTELSQEFDKLYNDLTSTISEGEFMIRLAQLVNKIKCGHTYLNPWNMDEKVRERLFNRPIFFPVGIEVLNGRFYVTENVSQHQSIKKGAEIVSLNSVSSQAVYDSLSTIAKRDGNNTNSIDSYLSISNFGIRDWEAFELYYPLFFPSESETITIEYKNYNSDKLNKVDLQLLTKKERFIKMKSLYGDLGAKRKEWKLSILDNEKAVLKIGTFAIWNWEGFNYKSWLSKTFTEINELGIKTLIVDIRGNGGGDSDAKDELLSYLVKDKIQRKEDTRSLIRTTKLPKSLLPYSRTYLKVLIDGLPKNQYETFDSTYYLFKKGINTISIAPKKKSFKRQTYILGNGSNTSATYTMLHLAKTYGFAKFVGSESGGNLQGINGSQYIFFNLPYSKMEIDIPLIHSQPTSEMPDRGVLPDTPVTRTQKSIAAQNDPFLELIE